MNKYFKYKYLLVTVLLCTACNDWLTLKPQDKIVGEDFWKTKEDVQAAVIGCYASLLDDDLTERLFLWGELRGDMVYAGAKTTTQETEIFNGNVQELNNIVDWGRFYKTINYCNTVIEFAPNVAKLDDTFTPELMNQYLSEVLTLRSLLYFYLVRSFRDVPLKLKATISDESDITLPKSTAEEILAQIVSDLNVAETSAVETYGNKAMDKGRVTKYTVNALQADVYLWMNEYQNSVDACNKIINSKQFGLIKGSVSNIYKLLYVDGNSNEGIFEFQFDVQRLNPLCDLTNIELTSSPSVQEDIFGTDLTDVTKRDLRGVGISIQESGRIWKYMGLDVSNSDVRPTALKYPHFIIYRYADILLMKAEALNQLGGGAEALELVKTIRNRAEAITLTSRNPDPANVGDVAQYIMEERAREFAFEGKRWYDILRNAKRNNYERLGILIDLAVKNAPPDRQQSIIAKLKDVDSHYFPIYQPELQKNENLEQNPFYLKQ